MSFVVRPRTGVIVDLNPCRDASTGLVAPDLGLAQRGKRGDRDVLINVPGVPAEIGGGPGTGIQLSLESVESFPAGEAEALRGVEREAVRCTE